MPDTRRMHEYAFCFIDENGVEMETTVEALHIGLALEAFLIDGWSRVEDIITIEDIEFPEGNDI